MTVVNRKVSRETYGSVFDLGKRRPVIVSIEPPDLLGFRLKGTRRTYYLTTGACYIKAVQVDMAFRRQERDKAKKAKKGTS